MYINILVVDDSIEKPKLIQEFINNSSFIDKVKIHHVSNVYDCRQKLRTDYFDILILDLNLPRTLSEDPTVTSGKDLWSTLLLDKECSLPEEVFFLTALETDDPIIEADLADKGVLLWKFYTELEMWKKYLLGRINLILEKNSRKDNDYYDCVVICALKKEAQGFVDAGYEVSTVRRKNGLSVMEMYVNNSRVAIVTCPRAGLVSCAITATKAIEMFKPKLICMSGICAGVSSDVNIYDVIIPSMCFQHDAGKWLARSLISEPYPVQIDHQMLMVIDDIISNIPFMTNISENVTLNKSEIPDEQQGLAFKIMTATCSSGSAVVADDSTSQSIQDQHRKLTGFEMESFAVYESARLANVSPKFFSAKSVVDNGTASKGDRFHRVACILSAKVVFQLIHNKIWECS